MEDKVKELKDYLHLYLGCEVVIEGKRVSKGNLVPDITRGTFLGYWDNHRLDCRIGFRAGPDGHIQIFFIKPLLRRLDSMTEEDANEFDIGRDTNKLWSIWHDAILFGEGFHSFTPEQTLFLLKKGFDLFGLIDAGLAIDINQK